VRPIEAQGSCTAAATKSQGAHVCYSSDVPFYNNFFTYALYPGETMYLVVIAKADGHTKY